MSAFPKVYRFATAQQWQSCLLHRFTAGVTGSLAPARRLAAAPLRIGDERVVGTVASSPGGMLYARLGAPLATDDAPTAGLIRVSRMVDPDTDARTDQEDGPFGIDGALATSPRWAVDRHGIWAFAPSTPIVHRYDRETLQHGLDVDIGASIRDIAADGRGGVWLLIGSEENALEIAHVDCRGCRAERFPVPCAAYAPRQICVVRSVGGGEHIVLLSGDGRQLLFVDPTTKTIVRVLSVGTLESCWRATLLASDGRQRIVLWGEQRIEGEQPVGIAFVCDADGDVIDGPLRLEPVEQAAHVGQVELVEQIGAVTAIALHRDALVFATDTGLWRLIAGEDSHSHESDGVILTPALLSPDSDATRGWLRAEVFATLPRGAVLEAEYATTNDPAIASQASYIAGDRSTVTREKQDAIWQLLEHPPGRRFRFTAANAAGQPLAIPLFESRDRWCWLRLSLMAPPGSDTGAIAELRVLYPDLSIARHLPAAFFGDRKDPSGAMRRLVGVLESTSQRIDEKIRGIGSHIDPQTAPPEWLDYLGRWLDLPWDDQLTGDVKRRLLQNAGPLLEKRGTRAGLALLMHSLIGSSASSGSGGSSSSARITDLTVDHAAAVLGGCGSPGVRLPLLLAGTVRTPTLGEKAVLGRVCLNVREDALDVIVPSVHITLTAPPEIRKQIGPLVQSILTQYVPAGVRITVSWRSPAAFASAMSDGDGVVLDDVGPGRVQKDGTLGRVRLGGRKNTVGGTGLAVGFRLR